MQDQDKELGLSSNNRNLLVVLFATFLLIWGPIEPYGLVVRFAYLLMLPTLLWLGLSYFGRKWKVDQESNDRLTRAVAGIIAGVFFVGAYFAFTAKYHQECTQTVRTSDGTECVGDYMGVKGPDIAEAVLLITFGAVATWYAVSKREI